MALIIIRGDTYSKVITCISDMENEANFTLTTSPKIINPKFADGVVSGILNSEIKHKSHIAVGFYVEQSTNLSIKLIRQMRPPAHIVVVTKDYIHYSNLVSVLNNAKKFTLYKPNIVSNDGLIDYKIDKKGKRIENGKYNCYR